ncbi:nucleoside deaminase (plasmid) [Polaromonas sp. P1-6]|nr:nucleoside deaminase [Polaromonas sp. P1-6]
MTEIDLRHLRSAIAVAWRSREHGNHPFGAVLADGAGKLILEAENTVNTERDSIGHAEANLVRLANRLFTAQQLADCTMYASTEPCAMCAGATCWGKIGRVAYALAQVDLYDLVGRSPGQLVLPCRDVFACAGRPLEVLGPCVELVVEARAVHANFWTGRSSAKTV